MVVLAFIAVKVFLQVFNLAKMRILAFLFFEPDQISEDAFLVLFLTGFG